MDKKDEYIIRKIPKNVVDSGRCLNGLFKTRNLIEAFCLAIPLGLILSNIQVSNFILKAQIMLIVCIIPFAAGVYGIPPYSLLEYIGLYFKYRKSKHYARYNKRLKWETKPEYLVHQLYETPFDRLMNIIDMFGNRKAKDKSAISDEISNPHHKEIFRDDEGFVLLPDELKDKQTLKAEARDRRREQKEVETAIKKQVKEQKKQGKKSKKDKKGNCDG